MSLATRCTACGTAFRVVDDQLKVSEGWVRCGRCNEVFNALEGLFDLGRDGHLAPQPEAATIEGGEAAQVAPDAPAAASLDGAPDREVDQGAASALPPVDANAPETDEIRPAAHAAGGGRSTAIDSSALAPVPATIALARPHDQPSLVDAATADAHEAATVPASTWGNDAEANAPTPNFLLDSRRPSIWTTRHGRLALCVAGVLLAVALVGQAAHHFRDVAAARWPAARPVLAEWCTVAGCTLAAPRRIDDIAVESTALTRAGTADAFRLAVVLQNRGALRLAMPSLDLSLTDTGGALIARRVLMPRDFAGLPDTLAPGAEPSLQLLLSVGSARVTGYTVEIFYP
jgi:predicted Zn finger-like uncharacterized protein